VTGNKRAQTAGRLHKAQQLLLLDHVYRDEAQGGEMLGAGCDSRAPESSRPTPSDSCFQLTEATHLAVEFARI
jgi:hypothetical protein